ncbi:MAG: apolipoprotein N-acyltransferase [Candidatus Omnitrophica bacterium]|nr:apolipoprotein N-acyltransferase [Candidatus Omnitrophota bacterium]
MSPLTSRQSPVWKDFFLAVISGVVLSLSFPAANLEFLAWVAFVPLFVCLKEKSKTKAFLLAYLAGVVFWSFVIYWLVHVTLVGTVLLVLYLAFYFGFFGLAFSLVTSRPPSAGSSVHDILSSLLLASAWVVLEYARSHLLTGFPWALLGYSQYLNLPVIQIADIFGAWGVSFVVMMVNACLYSAFAAPRAHDRKDRRVFLIKTLAVPCVCLAVAAGYGFFALHRLDKADTRKSIKVAVIQANIPQESKWDPAARGSILEQYLAISAQSSASAPDLLVWPEASLPTIVEDEPRYLGMAAAFARSHEVSMLIGAITRRNQMFYNSALLVSSDGTLEAGYDKLHLVPFGEYVPLKKVLPFLETVVPIGDATPGKDFTIFDVYLGSGPAHSARSRFGVLICFEDVFPELAREFVKRGAHFLVNITNDAWYKKTSAAEQHFQASVFRAVENRVNVVRSANTGISGFISPQGKAISLVEEDGEKIFVAGGRTRELRNPRGMLSIYTSWGDWFVVACLIFFWFASGAWRRFCPLCRIASACGKGKTQCST